MHPHNYMMPGYTFLTNIPKYMSHTYHTVAIKHNINYAITVRAFDKAGNIVKNYKGFWVSNITGDLSNFWNDIRKVG